MQRWIRNNITLSVLMTALSSLLMGVAYAAVLNSDVQSLKQEVFGIPPEKSISKRLERLEEKTNNIEHTVNNIEKYLRP